MRKITRFVYTHIVKPILFLFPADSVHEFFLTTGRLLSRHNSAKELFRKIWAYEDPSLEQNIFNLKFKNPIGLSAGFDYDADLVKLLPSIGFGFHTVGTLTNGAYAGNPAPMLARLPKSQSLLVNKGFKNKGIKKVLINFDRETNQSPIGVSIGATNKTYSDFEAMLRDLVDGFRQAENFKNFDYYELNISCPNLLNIKNLKTQIASPLGLSQALRLLDELGLSHPVFIKMPLERTIEEIKELIDVANNFSFIKGLIFSNLAKDRTNKAFDAKEIKLAGKGNFSGKPVEEKSNELLNFAYKNYKDRFVLIGVGGVFTATDAYKKIKLGATLVQMITGMVFMGPSQIGIINRELALLLKQDGHKNIAEAIGADLHNI